MWLTKISIQRPVFILMFVLAFLVIGIRSHKDMNAELYPKVDFPFVTITTIYPGAGPEEVETLITKPIEDAVGSINNLKNLTSSSQEGISTVALEFYIGTDVNIAVADVRQKVDMVRKKLPQSVDTPIVGKFDVSAMPVLSLAMSGNRSAKELRYLADNVVKYELSKVPGVGSVSIGGGEVREIKVLVDKERLAAYGLSIMEVLSAIGSQNINVPSGHISEGKKDYSIRMLGEFKSIDEIKNLRIFIPTKFTGYGMLNIYLKDVAEIIDGTAPREEITRIDGRESVGIVIIKMSDANTVKVVDGVKKELAKLKEKLGKDIDFKVAQDQSLMVKAALDDVNLSLLLGALLAVLVVFLFLHNLRGTFIVALAIPTSIIATFIPMYFLGFTLNQMTMLGLSLVVGILVDDSIVVIENIYRHLQRGELPREAALNGRTEIGLAAVTITLVDVVVFVPIAFMGGIVGQFFKQFGLTVAFSTLFSLFMSFTFTPMLASRWYKQGEDLETKKGVFHIVENFYKALDNYYRRLLGFALRHRAFIVISGVTILIFTFKFFGSRLSFQFVPAIDQGYVITTLEMPAGTSLSATDKVVKKIETVIKQIPETQTVFTEVGRITGGVRSSSGSEKGYNFAQVQIKLKDKKNILNILNPALKNKNLRSRSDAEVAEDLRKRLFDIAGGKIVVATVSGFGGGVQAPIEIELYGDDLNKMAAIAKKIKKVLDKHKGIYGTDISLRSGKPEVQVILDRVKAAKFGISVQTLAFTLRSAIEGNTDIKYREKGDEFDVRIKLSDVDVAKVEDVGNIVIGGMGGAPIKVSDVAEVKMGSGPTKIDRKNRLREVLVTGYLLPGFALGNVQQEVTKDIDNIALGGITLNWGGQAEAMREEGGYMGSALGLSIILVYMLMATLFNSLLHPFTILLSLPMALVGAIIALVIGHETLSIISMIGFIMLVGLVSKNAILLIDFTNTLRARGYERNAAVQEAGPTRLRPILMTTIAMVLGMLPIALRLGRASEMRAPLGVAVIGGLILSTLLTLVMIPVIYTLFDDLVNLSKKIIAKVRR